VDIDTFLSEYCYYTSSNQHQLDDEIREGSHD
jgi:hypothetical protein